MIKIEVSTNDILMIADSVFSDTVSDGVMHRTVQFLFPKRWDSYQKTAVFSADGVEPINILLDAQNRLCVDENQCYIPFEVLKGDRFYVSVFGVNGDSLATTTKIAINVKMSGYALGDTPSDPTPSQYQQIIDLTQETKQIAQSVRDDADNGVFDGRQGVDGKDAVTDLVYNPQSENAQSGMAVAEALDSAVTPEKIKDSIEGITFVFDGGNAFDGFEDEEIIDEQMSDNSPNPVQNRVIKNYVDTSIVDTSAKFNNDLETLSLEMGQSVENSVNAVRSIIQPVGSVYIASSAEFNPSMLYGGEWELFDKEFKSSSGDLEASDFEFYNNTTLFKPSDATTGASYIRAGHDLRLRICIYLNVNITNTTTQLLKIKNLSALGIGDWDCNFYNLLCGSDGGNAVIIAQLVDGGLLETTEVVTKTSGDLTIDTGNPPVVFADVTIPIRHEYMLNEYCDKFYWKRIA